MTQPRTRARRSSTRSSRESTPRSQGPVVADFIEGFLRLTKGDLAGSLIQLRPWQKGILNELFVQRADGRLRYRRGLLGLPRKNGKSLMGAGIALYGLVLGEAGSEVYSCAGDRPQARIVFGEAARMVELDPTLSSMLRVYRDAIEYPGMGSIYRALSADAPRQEGLNPSLVIFDEVHVQPNAQLWSTMNLGSGARRDPLCLGITTAGVKVDSSGSDSLCYSLYQYGKRVESGEVDDPTFFFRWYCAPDEADHRDPETWRIANPAFGDFLDPEDFESAVRTIHENEFRTKRLNQWRSVETAWLPAGAWEACQDEDARLDSSLPVYVGIDVSLRNDATAVVAAQRQDARLVVRARIWENPYDPTDGRYDLWRVNHGEVEAHLRYLYEAFPVPAVEIDGEPVAGPEFAYDPAFFSDAARRLTGDGMAMVEFPQTDTRMVPACQGLYELIVTQTVRHDNDPALARHLANAAAKETGRGWRLTKGRGHRGKIDGAIALAIATHEAQRAQALPEEREPMVAWI